MRISFIGAGNMAGAIIRSALSSRRLKPEDITVYDINPDKYKEFEKLGVNAVISISEALRASDSVLLAIKPQDYDAVLTEIKNSCYNCESKLFISIAAAISTSYICNKLGVNCPVVRVMPNTPLMLGFGATAISRNNLVTDKEYSKICGLFAASGTVTSLNEDLMNNVISVNGSSPVYVYLLAKSMIDEAVNQGLDADASKALVYQTLRGSVEMLIKSGMSPEELIKMVASPNGTTEAALKKFDELEFNNTIHAAMQACTERAEEMKR